MTDNEIRKENERTKMLLKGAQKPNLPSHARSSRTRAFGSYAIPRYRSGR